MLRKEEHMAQDKKLNELYELLKETKVTPDNIEQIQEVKKLIENGIYEIALTRLKDLSKKAGKNKKQNNKKDTNHTKVKQEIDENNDEEEDIKSIYPLALQDPQLERKYIGMLLVDPKLIAKYYVVYDECLFEERNLLEIYKGILFTEGEAYAPGVAKELFNFGKNTFEINTLKKQLKNGFDPKSNNLEKIYLEIRKLFILRKNYLEMPVKSIQDRLIEIVDYKLYDHMSIDEVKSAINQINVTDKFKQSILNENLTEFLIKGDNSLTNGLKMPFPIISSKFKGIRKGETMAFAMPSNSGKSRFTINLAAYICFVHKKKVLIISNEMSEEKMKLCLITTILNNKAFQELHGQHVTKTEGELLEFKFRPDKNIKANVDADGFIMKEKNETQEDFSKRLSKISTEFRQTVIATDWIKEQMDNSIYFTNITDHTNDELKKTIMNYYYKEEIEYIFYDTLKTDTANIGNGEEIKKTATILSNLAQNFNIFIGSTLQLTESSTLPINLNINDLAVSRTVKEVLDTLCLIKQINRENYADYEYSLKEVDTEFFDIEKFEDPDVRYYACVVDKNRAGAKPKTLFRLNLAYNHWEELGYLKLKHGEEYQD